MCVSERGGMCVWESVQAVRHLKLFPVANGIGGNRIRLKSHNQLIEEQYLQLRGFRALHSPAPHTLEKYLSANTLANETFVFGEFCGNLL